MESHPSAADADTRRESLAIMAREEIERRILTGKVRAGERLNENALAAKLNISRGPLREAARSLEQLGLVEIVRNRGVFVRRISLRDALDVYDVRAGLARVAGRLAARRVSTAQLDGLEGLHEQMEETRRHHDSDAYYEVNQQFHARLFEVAGNARLASIHEATEKELQLFLRRGVLGSARLKTSNLEHRRILDAIRDGDEEEAARTFERHCLRGKQRMLDSLASTEDRSRPRALMSKS